MNELEELQARLAKAESDLALVEGSGGYCHGFKVQIGQLRARIRKLQGLPKDYEKGKAEAQRIMNHYPKGYK